MGVLLPCIHLKQKARFERNVCVEVAQIRASDRHEALPCAPAVPSRWGAGLAWATRPQALNLLGQGGWTGKALVQVSLIVVFRVWIWKLVVWGGLDLDFWFLWRVNGKPVPEHQRNISIRQSWES